MSTNDSFIASVRNFVSTDFIEVPSFNRFRNGPNFKLKKQNPGKFLKLKSYFLKIQKFDVYCGWAGQKKKKNCRFFSPFLCMKHDIDLWAADLWS